MQQNDYYDWLKVILSILAAMMFMALPLPSGISQARPNLLLLVLLFWAMQPPHRVGIVIAWICGLLLDVMTAHVLGEQALVMILFVYLAHKLHRQILMFHVLQQMLILFAVSALYQVFVLLIQGMLHQLSLSYWYWLSPLTTGVVWLIFTPWLNRNAIAKDDYLILKQ